jgi:hypothetical protein
MNRRWKFKILNRNKRSGPNGNAFRDMLGNGLHRQGHMKLAGGASPDV